MTKLWTRVFTDPVKGHVVAVDEYRVPRKLRRLLRERDQRCRWPGCTAARQLGHGVLVWTSPEGRVYVDEPEPVGPRFTESYMDWLWRGFIGPLPETPF